jgi:hypothetical protein
MEYCPHCHDYYDDDNDTQPCCGCGHPIVCCWAIDDDAGDDSENVPGFAEAEAEYCRQELDNYLKRKVRK